MSRILIVYESKYGQTEKIAKFIQERMEERNYRVNLMSLGDKRYLPPENYDAIIVGAPIYMRRYPRKIRTWVRVHSPILNRKMTAFFSVGLGILQEDLAVQRDLLLIADNFFKRVEWYPKRRVIFAGALSYTNYNWLLKKIMSLIARGQDAAHETSRDYEYTNWEEVRKFCENFSTSLDSKRDIGRDGNLQL